MNLKKTAAIVGGTTGASYLTYQAISDHMFKRAFKKRKREIPVEEKVAKDKETALNLFAKHFGITRSELDGLITSKNKYKR